jgi:hypothetical protein
MPRLVYISPTNYRVQYVTALVNDPNVPAGYILTSGSDGAPDQALQQYVAGVNSGGFPAYTGDPTQAAVSPNHWINGILGRDNP